jgi:dienelactone hydrolase
LSRSWEHRAAYTAAVEPPFGGSATDPETLRTDIGAFLQFSIPDRKPTVRIHETVQADGYKRLSIGFGAPDGDTISAYLLMPAGTGPFPAVIAHHQHNGERHLGKSEVCGLAGNQLQAFGPSLARSGLVVLAPDSICFEDRRRQMRGLQRDPKSGTDWLQHYNEMAYRLLLGDLLMRKVLVDSASGVSLLAALDEVDPSQIGIIGHSYGGNTVLFHAALDVRLRFACSSGAASTYATKMASDTGIEEAGVIPGFVKHWDIQDLVACIAPRPLLLVSATEDPYSVDAPDVEAGGRWGYAAKGAESALKHLRFEGGHDLTPDRFHAITNWVSGIVPR